MPRVRLGVALLIPSPQAAAVDTLRLAVGDPALGRIPAHLTLVPPVNVREDRLPEAFGLLRKAAGAAAPLTLTLGPPATFLPDNPVLYLGVSGATERLQALRDAVFIDPFSRPLTWPFVPHVTLADQAPSERIRAALAALCDFRVDVRINQVHVLQEMEGRRWEPIADAFLGAPAVVARGGLELELSRSTRPDSEAAAWAAANRPEQTFAFTARRGGQVVGLASGRVEGETAHLVDLMVDSSCRGEGIGSHLLAAVESLAAGDGCTSLTLRTEAGSRAEAFYRGRGWVPESRLSRFRQGRDFVQLRRDLI